MTRNDLHARLADTMAGRARDFLSALTEGQRAAAHLPFTDPEERTRWFYTPTDHGGLPLSAMTPTQQQRAHQLVASGLSRGGYVSVSTIMGLDNVLDELEGWGSSWGRERGRDPGLYYLRVFGDPAPDSTWSWRFGGHHVSLNVTVVDGLFASFTPCFLGADPASSPLLGPHPLRPLAGAEDYARELLHSLTESQRLSAIVSPVPPVDIAGANRSRIAVGDTALPLADVWRGRFTGELDARVRTAQEGIERAVGVLPEHLEAVRFTADPKGVRAATFTPAQRDLLRRLLDVYVRRMPDEMAEAESAKFDAARLDSLHFLWAGGAEPGVPHYYRIQGPRLVVEYDNAARNANHVHTVWRDPEGDFAVDSLADHYRSTTHPA